MEQLIPPNSDSTMPPLSDNEATRPEASVTELNSSSPSDDEVHIELTCSVHKRERQAPVVPVITIDNCSDEENIETNDLSKKMKLEKDSSDSTEIQDTGCRSPKDQTCSICLGEFDNKSFLDQCFHTFCFYCILQWSEIVRTCPLCKARFSKIIHSVKSMAEYELHKLPAQQNPTKVSSNDRRFRYRTTVVDDMHEPQQQSTTASSNIWLQRAERRERILSTRRSKIAKTKEKRRSIYARNLWVQTVTQTGRPKYRDTSPQFFRANPACTHRLVPWLTRELQCLLDDEASHVDFVLQLILSLITKIQVDSDDFIEQLRPFLTDKTEHFAHEFLSYARSPFDTNAFDQRAKYQWPSINTEQVAQTPMTLDVSTTGWDSPDETETSVAIFYGVAGPSGISDSIEVVSSGSTPIAQPIDQSRVWDTDDENIREQTTNQESNQNRNDVIELSPEVVTIDVPKQKRHKHKHKHKGRRRHKHMAYNRENGSVGELSVPGPSYVRIYTSDSRRTRLDVIVVSSEGTGSPDSIEISSHNTASRLDSSPATRLSKSRSSSRKTPSKSTRLSRDSSSERSKSREDCRESRRTRTHSKRNSSRSRDGSVESSSRGRSSKSRDDSCHKRSRSRNECHEPRNKTYSRLCIPRSKSPMIHGSRDSISRDVCGGGSSEDGVARPSSPTEQQMKLEIVELERKIAEDTKRLEELLTKQEERKQGIGISLLGIEGSETDGQSR